jgi:RimJ/RimL family protein N-acetyltransferase
MVRPFHDPQLRFRSAPRLETDRLVLRDLELSDLDYFLRIFQDEDVTRFIGGLNDSENTFRKMMAGKAFWPLTGVGMWAVERKSDEATIGHLGFFDFLRPIEPPISNHPEMGWIFAPEAQGQGLASEACCAALDWFEAHFGKQDIHALISPGNDASMRLAERLGFERRTDGTYRDQPQTMWVRPA